MTRTPTVTPSATVEPESVGERLTVRYSWYWPPLGGINTSMPWAPHLARTANGDRWQEHVGTGIACPRSWPFGTRVLAFGSWWECVDRGGAIKYVDGIPWLDFLVSEPHTGFGELMEVEVRWP